MGSDVFFSLDSYMNWCIYASHMSDMGLNTGVSMRYIYASIHIWINSYMNQFIYESIYIWINSYEWIDEIHICINSWIDAYMHLIWLMQASHVCISYEFMHICISYTYIHQFISYMNWFIYDLIHIWIDSYINWSIYVSHISDMGPNTGVSSNSYLNWFMYELIHTWIHAYM